MTERDPHRCASGGGCTNFDINGSDPETGRDIRVGAALTADSGPLCGGCYARLRSAIKGMPGDWLRLKASLGENLTDDAGGKVHLTRTPAIPLNTAVEALMCRIVEVAERAAEMVESELGIDVRPTSDYTDPRLASVDRAAKRLDTTLDVLLDIEAQPMLVWGRIPTGDDGWDEGGDGQPRELVEMDGLDVAAQIVRVNREVGVRLGKAHLRHTSALPCDACGGHELGRDDGTWVINCLRCGAKYSEDELGFLIRMKLSEIESKEENDMLRYLLAEAYWRLDSLQLRADALADEWDVLAAVLAENPDKSLEILRLVTQQFAGVLTDGPEPHPRPEERQNTTPEKKKQKELTR